jgi:hypothetical protein
MREYLDAEHGEAEGPAIALMPVLTSVSDDLSPWAALREVRIRMMGTCSAELSIKASGLRRALEYLLSAMIERQAAGSEITFRMSENPSEALVRIEGERGLGNQPNSNRTRDSVGSTMRRVRLAIAARVLESAGVTLACDDDVPGLVLRLPHVGGPSV